MDSLKNVLLNRNLDKPSELTSIEEFLAKFLGEFPSTVTDYPKNITIAVGNGKVAYHLRTLLPKLEAYAAPTKKIYIRIDPSLES